MLLHSFFDTEKKKEAKESSKPQRQLDLSKSTKKKPLNSYIPVLKENHLGRLILPPNSLSGDGEITLEFSLSRKIIWMKPILFKSRNMVNSIYTNLNKAEVDTIILVHKKYYRKKYKTQILQLKQTLKDKLVEFPIQNLVKEFERDVDPVSCCLLGDLFAYFEEYKTAKEWYLLSIEWGCFAATENLKKCEVDSKV